MALDKRARDEMRTLCGEVHGDDGVDPRQFFQKRGRARDLTPKAEQLCRQAAETLSQLFGGEMGDDRLNCLRVESVQPAPDSSRLLVTVVADCAPGVFDRDAIDRQLQAAAGRLRTAVAEAITRRKAPSLVFVVLAPAESGQIREQGASHEES
ncbi:MAG: ribosome-binding factor A [Pirellulales bacterium]|nr:ribosome-binding factor A [Pirellulales bacterium]